MTGIDSSKLNFHGNTGIITDDYGTLVHDRTSLATCTASVNASATIAVCTYQSSTTPHTVACSISGGTLTAVSATTLDSGVVAYTVH